MAYSNYIWQELPVDPTPDAARRPLTDVGRPLTDVGRPLTDVSRPLTDVGRPLTNAGRPLTKIRCNRGVATPCRLWRIKTVTARTLPRSNLSP